MSQSRSLRIDRTFAQQRGAGAGLVGAVVLHIAIIGATLFTFAHKLDIVDQSAPVVPVDLVTISDKNNVRATVAKNVKLDSEIVQPKAELDATPPEVPDEAPSEPQVPTPQPMLLPETKPLPAKPQDKPRQQQKQAFDVNNILSMLDKQAKPTGPNAKPSNRTQKGIGAQDANTADLVTSLANQVRACWSPPTGAPNAADLTVDFDLTLNRDGSISRLSQLAGGADAAHPYMRAAAEAAKRAIYTCQPYKLPANRFGDWQEINPFHFDPRDVAGQ